MVGHGGSSAGSYLADPTSPVPSHFAVIILFKSVTVHRLSWPALYELSDTQDDMFFSGKIQSLSALWKEDDEMSTLMSAKYQIFFYSRRLVSWWSLNMYVANWDLLDRCGFCSAGVRF